MILEKFRSEHGDKPVALLTRQHINAMLANKVTTPAAANHWLRMVKSLMVFAVEEGWRGDNPTVGIRRIKNRSAGFHTWDETRDRKIREAAPGRSKARLALALLLYTAQRRSDVVRMGRQHVRDGVVHVRQQKTGAKLAIPLHPALAAHHRGDTERPPDLSHDQLWEIIHSRPALGIGSASSAMRPDYLRHCAAHGLRKAACRRLAEAGCSANVIASISGHTTLTEVARYTKAADQERMARDGMAAISRTETGNGDKTVAKSGK